MLNNKLREILSNYHKGGIESSECTMCSSPCCSSGGFAILENVIAIYEIYREDKLNRNDYEFPKGLSLKEFIFKYFDVVYRDVDNSNCDDDFLVFFHMKSLDEKNRLISIPDENYWETRAELFNKNTWLSKGCVFLSDSIVTYNQDDDNIGRKCILHGQKSTSGVSAKPIDCSFFTCSKKGFYKFPDKKTSENWIKAINNSFPSSVNRLKEILSNDS